MMLNGSAFYSVIILLFFVKIYFIFASFWIYEINNKNNIDNKKVKVRTNLLYNFRGLEYR